MYTVFVAIAAEWVSYSSDDGTSTKASTSNLILGLPGISGGPILCPLLGPRLLPLKLALVSELLLLLLLLPGRLFGLLLCPHPLLALGVVSLLLFALSLFDDGDCFLLVSVPLPWVVRHCLYRDRCVFVLVHVLVYAVDGRYYISSLANATPLAVLARLGMLLVVRDIRVVLAQQRVDLCDMALQIAFSFLTKLHHLISAQSPLSQ